MALGDGIGRNKGRKGYAFQKLSKRTRGKTCHSKRNFGQA